MKKKGLIALVAGVLLLGYSAFARYSIGGLRIYSLDITMGKALTASLPYAFCFGVVLFLVGVPPLISCIKTAKISKAAKPVNLGEKISQPPQPPPLEPQQATADQTIIDIPTKPLGCTRCGAALKDGARFCTKCGAKNEVGEDL